jgi:hypothetical protein
MDRDFLPFVRASKAPKPNTIRFYENSVANLKGYSKLAGLPLDQITTGAAHTGFAESAFGSGNPAGRRRIRVGLPS